MKSADVFASNPEAIPHLCTVSDLAEPDLYPNKSPISWPGPCITIPPESEFPTDPEFSRIYLSATSKFEACVNEAVPATA